MPRWFFLTCVAVLCWGLWSIILKLIGESITAAQSQALSTLGLIPVMLALGRSKKLAAPGNRRRGIINALLAGVLTCAGNIAYYHALNVGGKASTVVPLTALYPLVTIVLAVILLRERLNRVQVLGIAVSLVAIYLFNVGSVEGVVSPWLVYALLPIGLWGVSGLLQKISTNDISGELSAFWFLAAFVPVSVALLILQPLAGPLAMRTWLLVAALGSSSASATSRSCWPLPAPAKPRSSRRWPVSTPRSACPSPSFFSAKLSADAKRRASSSRWLPSWRWRGKAPLPAAQMANLLLSE